MNPQNPNSKENDHKSEKDDGPQTLALLQKIKNGQINPKSIGKEERRLLVRFLKAEGQPTAEIAHLLNVSDKTIERDKKADSFSRIGIISKSGTSSVLASHTCQDRVFRGDKKCVLIAKMAFCPPIRVKLGCKVVFSVFFLEYAVSE